jgi:hypothetical protein
VIDLHLHTTASDGLCSPRELVERAAAAGLSRMAVTDHDTTAALGESADHCARAGIAFVPGIEITAILEGADVHLLGYFIDARHAPLAAFLARQRDSRVERIRRIADRLSELGAPIDAAPLLEAGRRQDGRSIGRPQVARALMAAGHAADVNDAFDRFLGRGQPAFVARTGARPEEVIGIVHAAGGLASLAHPGLTEIDDRIPALRDAGLDAIEAYHSEHDPAVRDRYLALAADLGLLVTGGSDFHGDPAHGLAPGSVTLPADHWQRLSEWRPRS